MPLYNILLIALNLLLLLLYTALYLPSSAHSDFQGYHTISTLLFDSALIINPYLTIVCILPISPSIRRIWSQLPESYQINYIWAYSIWIIPGQCILIRFFFFSNLYLSYLFLNARNKYMKFCLVFKVS